MVRDKSVEKLVNLFPVDAKYYFCKPNAPRGFEAEKIAQIFKEKGYNGQVYSSVNEAFSTAKAEAKEQDLIFVGGSTFVVAEVL